MGRALHKGLVLLILFIFTLPVVDAQTKVFGVLSGIVVMPDGDPAKFANIAIVGSAGGTTTDENGHFELVIPAEAPVAIAFSLVGCDIKTDTFTVEDGGKTEVKVVMANCITYLPTINIQSHYDMPGGIFRMDPREGQLLPNATGGLEFLLKLTALGMASGNELSSQYSVRGGNFDENLVYANDIEIYRPFLIRSGQQEGLSFLNSDLVSSVAFSSGGFEAKYGDKLSSVLDVMYKRPREFAAGFSLSPLGANGFLEGCGLNHRFMYLLGVRYKSSQYILNGLETKGEYRPVFADVQTYLTWQINEISEINLLGYYSLNSFNLVPQTRETSYGTVNEAYRLTIYFDGQERDRFNTLMGAMRYIIQPDSGISLKFIASAYTSLEDETFDIQGQYWIGRLESDLGKETFGDVAENLGVGTYLEHARNQLTVKVYAAEHKGIIERGNHHTQWGIKVQHDRIQDELLEWKYLDSSAFSLPHPPDSIGYTDPAAQTYQMLEMSESMRGKLNLNSMRYSAFIQHSWQWLIDSTRVNLVTGIRGQYWDVNKEYIISPRVAVALTPHWKEQFSFRFATGLYQQPPFYREIRSSDGNLFPNVKAQKSVHFVSGIEYEFKAWDRPFRLVTELYYKMLYDMVPYVVENVRIRYLPQYNSHGYAAGIDFKLHGQFVQDAESWVSVSVMQTREDIEGDYYYKYYNAAGEQIISGYTYDNVATDSVRFEPGYLPRPTDQRVNVSLFFQDYLPKNPTYKMHLSLVYGAGLPFGPPGEARYKQTLRTPPYRRVDIGFSKQLIGQKKPEMRKSFKYIKNAWLSMEVFNLLAINNVVSYIWVADVTGRYYAVPNYLTSRQLNLRLLVQF